MSIGIALERSKNFTSNFRRGSAAEVRKQVADGRKQVSSAYLNDLPKSISGLNLAAAQGGRFENVNTSLVN